MALYQYRCDRDGVLEVNLPIGTAPRRHPCPHCSGAAPRVFSTPMLGLAPRPLVQALDRAERSRHEPEVVNSPPPSGRRRAAPAPQNPALRRLPRP